MAAKSPVQQIYDILNGLYGEKLDLINHPNAKPTQIFQMEFAARILDKGTYDYPGSDTINAQQVKPQVVQEAEFRLANDILPLSNVMGGPTGAKLADKYNDILFSLVPTVPEHDTMADLIHSDQDKICAWLLEEVPNWIPPKDDILKDIPSDFDEHKLEKPSSVLVPDDEGEDQRKTIPRIDLYQKILDSYEIERFRWVQFKLNARPKDMATATPAAIDNYNRMLAYFAPVIDKKLEAMWTMLLIRGQYHRVRRFIGFVDVESASGSLQRAKESLRASVMRSIDDAEDVYPVYFSPATWATKLSTAFKPEDLLSSEESVREQMFAKQRERGQLLTKRNDVKASQQDLKPLQDAEQAARNKFMESRDKMVGGYSDTAIKLIKMYFDAKMQHAKNQEAFFNDFGQGAKKELDDIMEADAQPPLTAEQFEQLMTMQKECISNQTSLQNASEALARSQLATAQVRGNDTSAFLYELEEKISSLTLDIEYLMQILDKSSNATLKALHAPGQPGGQDISATPQHADVKEAVVVPQDGDASIWTETRQSLSRSTTYDSSLKTASGSHTDWTIDLFFGSASGSQTTTAGSSHETHDTRNVEIQIAFRSMKVQISRPWFNAGIFDRLPEYTSTSATPVQTILPAYPIAFIVVKDVHIVLKQTADSWGTKAADLQKNMSAGGGVLCFSVAKSESSSEHRTAASVSQSGDYLSIRIPAPQILGWIQQYVPAATTQPGYGPIDPKEFLGAVKDKASDNVSVKT